MHPPPDPLFHLLVALVAVVATARLVGALFRRLQQPAVVGEVLAGILLGPSLLGRVAPGVAAWVLPPSVAPQLGMIAQVGVILFMFLVGIELDLGLVTRRNRDVGGALAISLASMVVPFLLGGVLATALYHRLGGAGVSFPLFALFMGLAMSVTAFPVLARILGERGWSRSRLGAMALACAAGNDVAAWCLLALLVGLASSAVGGAITTVVASLAYFAVMVIVARPLLLKWVARFEEREAVSRDVVAAALVGALVSAAITQHIGIHALFGAFLLGSLVPHDSRVGRHLVARLEDPVVVLLLPAFFAFTGLRTQIGLLDGWSDWLWCAGIILVASAGKLGGTMAAARATGMGWRDSAALGALMNTRGLMELVVLNVGLDLGVISPRLFAALVIMAVVTTLATTPLVFWIKAPGASEASIV